MTELADILRDNTSSLNISKEQWRIATAIMNCRTKVLGGHLYQCNNCNTQEPRYNSCRNRHCPKCQGSQTAKWLEARAKELLPVPYFHLVFTVPHELNAIFLHNKSFMYSLLFKAQAKAIKDIAKKRLGSTGFFSVLHTWGKKLNFHPHVHTVVPGAYFDENQNIQLCSSKYFLPKNVLNKVFKAIFLKMIVTAYKKGKISFDEQEFKSIINKLKSKTWIVYAKKPFADPETVLKYLSCYTHRIAISNSRIKSYKDKQVSFLYKDYKAKASKRILTLKAPEFLRRFFLHTLPKEFVRIRYFGFLAASNRKTKLLTLKNKLPTPIAIKYKEPQPDFTCPHCKDGTLCHVKEINPASFIAKKKHKKRAYSP